MAKKDNQRLTPLETLIMDALWDESPAGVQQIQQKLHDTKPMAYNTVSTMMRILRDKGFLTSERVGRIDLYRPVVTREQMGRRSLRAVLESFFHSSPQALVSQLIDAENLDADALKALRREINQKLRQKD